MQSTELIGQVLDEKYRIEKELGKGGMGSVYLGTHLGTDRPVAVKVIAPQFMRNDEFVERFKREAKAAGRLHHPNVVNVTDFGFARMGTDRVAYLVMEYLDGCPLAEVLEEESQLAIPWVADIIEQTCSAVDTAHRHGIIHRDLKPDNIWLEPNRRGGYRVKVLDFGLAKLGDPVSTEASGVRNSDGAGSSQGSSRATQISTNPRNTQKVDPGTLAGCGGSEAATVMQPAPVGEAQTLIQTKTESERGAQISEAATQIMPASSGENSGATRHAESSEDEATRVMQGDTTKEVHPAETMPMDGLTRVGSILGTPLYMSPEQCRSEALDARTDIYSLGVIAYQMLAGSPPFTGSMNDVMRQHIESPPPPLRKKRKKIPKRLAKVVMGALAKNTADRTQNASGFAGALRAQSEGTGALLRRAFSLYSEHFPKFFLVSLIMLLPIVLLTLLDVIIHLLKMKHVVPARASNIASVITAVFTALGAFVATSVAVGVTIRLVNQLMLAPLRPVNLRLAFAAVKKRLKALILTTLMIGLLSLLLLICCIVPGVIFYINSSLIGPVVIMENLS